MKKKQFIKIMVIVLIIIFIIVSGYLILYQKSQKEETEKLYSSINIENEYGENAYLYLEYIQENLPNRIKGTKQEKQMAKFIVDSLLKMGYTRENISLQTFSLIQDPSIQTDNSELQSNELLKDSENNLSQNIILTVPGKSKKEIIVGAHYDSADTHGVDDNGSGVVTLLESALKQKGKDNEYTIKYIFFGAEEEGVKGSKYYANKLIEEEVKNIEFMVNVDSILAGDYCYIFGGVQQADGTVSQTDILYKTKEIAEKNNINVKLNTTGIRYPIPLGNAKSDHSYFSGRGIQYVYFSAENIEEKDGLETKKLGNIMHTKYDNLDEIEKHFGNRGKENLKTYSKLLYYILEEYNTK